MKKLLLTLFLILCFAIPFAFALTFHNANQVTLAWNAVTTDVDGDPCPDVTYTLLLANADTDPEKANPTIVAENITDLTATITLQKGRYFVGIQAVKDDLKSVINWADEVEGQEGVEIFGLRFAVPPSGPKDLTNK